MIFAKPTFRLPIVRDYDESSQGSANLHSIHIREKNKWGYPGIDVYIACIVLEGSHGVLIDACSSRFMCWKYDICHEIDVQSLIGINLGVRGKNKELRTIHIKHECERCIKSVRNLKHTCEENFFLFPFNSSLLELHYFDVAHGLKLFQLQDLRANLQQVWEYDRNRLSIVFLQLYEDPFEWKIAWRTSGIKLHRRPRWIWDEED